MALAVGMLLSPALWMSRPAAAPLAESFPMVPALSGLGALTPPPPFDAILIGGVLALCALGAVSGRRVVFAALFFACLLLAAQDMMRWQPWFYLYLALLGALVFVPAREVKAPRMLTWVEPLTMMRILVASVYLYSGLNKANAAFLEEQLGGFLAGMPPAISSGPVAAALTYSAPVLEMAAGAGLLLGGLAGLPRIRYGALAVAASTNLFVLVVLISSGANSMVWPWNLAMIALVFALFAARDKKACPQESPGGLTQRHTRRLWGYIYALVVVALVAVIPAAGLVGYWPSYLSWALYSENTSGAMVETPAGSAAVVDMAYEQLNVPAFPSEQVYEAVGERACGASKLVPREYGEPVLTIQSRPGILDGARESREYTCSPG